MIDLKSRLGRSEILQLAHHEWLVNSLKPKAPTLVAGSGGKSGGCNWEDRCGALASIDNPAAKALASLLVGVQIWGVNDGDIGVVSAYLAEQMVKRCQRDGRSNPKNSKHSLDDLARLMGRMVLYLELYDLWSVFTIEGRLVFSGIDINSSTYSNNWVKYQRLMLDDLQTLMFDINDAINNYYQSLTP